MRTDEVDGPDALPEIDVPLRASDVYQSHAKNSDARCGNAFLLGIQTAAHPASPSIP